MRRCKHIWQRFDPPGGNYKKCLKCGTKFNLGTQVTGPSGKMLVGPPEDKMRRTFEYK